MTGFVVATTGTTAPTAGGYALREVYLTSGSVAAGTTILTIPLNDYFAACDDFRVEISRLAMDSSNANAAIGDLTWASSAGVNSTVGYHMVGEYILGSTNNYYEGSTNFLGYVNLARRSTAFLSHITVRSYNHSQGSGRTNVTCASITTGANEYGSRSELDGIVINSTRDALNLQCYFQTASYSGFQAKYRVYGTLK